MNDKRKFDAFISYSRKTDLIFSEKLQHYLQIFAKPWYKSRILRIFRDKTNIRPSPSISTELKVAIDHSSFFILIASPGSAASEWVKNEIAYWLENHTTEQFIIILTGGKIVWDESEKDFNWSQTDALPNCLSKQFLSEPLYIDASSYGSSLAALNLKNKDFFDLIKTVSATLLKIDKDLLADEYRKQQYISISVFGGLAALVIIAMIITLIFKNLSDDNKQLAHDNYQLAKIENSLYAARNAEILIDKGYPEEALEELIEALPKDMRQQDRPYVSEVEEQFYNYLKKTAPSSAYYCLSDEQESYPTIATEINSFDICPKGKNFAVAVTEKSGYDTVDKTSRYIVSIHNLAQKAVIYKDESLDEELSVKFLQFNTDGKFLILVFQNNQIQVIDTRQSSILNRYFLGEGVTRLINCPEPNKALCVSSRGNFIFDIKSGKKITDFQPYMDIGYGTFNRTGNRFLGIPKYSSEGAVLYDATTGRILNELSIELYVSEKSTSKDEPEEYKHSDYFMPKAIFSNDDRFLVTLFEDSKIRVYDAKNGQFLSAFDNKAIYVDISPDGNYLIGAMEDQTAVIWDIENQKVLNVLRGHTEEINKAIFNPNGETVLTLSEDDGSAKLWNPKSGRCIATIKNEITDTAFSPDGHYIVTTSGGFRGDDNSVRVWDAHTGKFEKFISREWYRDYISYSVFSGNNEHVIYYSENRNIPDDLCVCDYKNDSTIEAILKDRNTSIRFIEFSNDCRKLLAGYKADYLKIWDIQSGSVMFEVHLDKACQSAHFSPNDKFIATISEGCYPKIFDARTGKLLYELVRDNDIVNDLNFSSDEKRIVTAYESGIATIWDTRTGKILKTYEKPPRCDYPKYPGITKSVFSPDGSKLLLVGLYGHGLIDLGTDEILDDFLFAMPINYSIFSKDSNYLITSTYTISDVDGIHVWDIKNEKYITTNPGFLRSKNAIAEKFPFLVLWNQIGGSSGVAQMAYIINYLTGEEIQEIYYDLRPAVEVINLTISANGEHLLIGEPGAISVWKVRTGKKIFEYNIDDDIIVGTQLSADGKNVAVAVKSGKIIILKIFASTQDLINAFK